MKRKYLVIDGKKVQVEGINVPRPRRVDKVGRHFKYSQVQMRSYAVRSSSIEKQIYWMRKLYSQKIYIAKKDKKFKDQVSLYKKQKVAIKKIIKQRGAKSLARYWRFAKTTKDFENLFFYGRLNEEQGKMIFIEDNGDKVFLYQGQDGYEDFLPQLQEREELLEVKKKK